ncbi:putative phage integrase domain protein (plasmid) [Ochrobactrum quorumnocens]|uniref:Putative phage integrase domain protein n=1 Tax=Ochrobactrum quorumnocens TaxID=271865 RepID=A0A248UPA8_9HYPH|nr:putative phage integrase domain protein [[Ochrobactrum] quorumnocens]
MLRRLRHLVNEGMGENTLPALTSDLAYLEAWAIAATSSPLPFPAPEALLLKFVTHPLWRPQQREIEPDHVMPSDVEVDLRRQGFLRVSGPHAPTTVRRRLANWSTLARS